MHPHSPAYMAVGPWVLAQASIEDCRMLIDAYSVIVELSLGVAVCVMASFGAAVAIRVCMYLARAVRGSI